MGHPETQIGPSLKEGPIWMDGLDRMEVQEERLVFRTEAAMVGGLKHKRRTHLDAPLDVLPHYPCYPGIIQRRFDPEIPQDSGCGHLQALDAIPASADLQKPGKTPLPPSSDG